MKVVVLPDIHLKPFIFERAREVLDKGIADKAVCLMDIPDDWRKEYQIAEYVRTFDAAIKFAIDFPNTAWCWGNHDLSYLWGAMETGYSFAAKATVQRKIHELQMAMSGNNSIQYIQRIDNVLFCHGGLSRYYVEKHIPKSKYDDTGYVIETINSFGEERIWNDDSPIWYRPQCCYGKPQMYKPRKLLQVVGHTPVKQIQREGNIISCDVFSTYQDGTPIGSQELLLIDTITWEYQGIN